MMGEQSGRQRRLFYEFCLEDRVPADHLLRKIDGVLDLNWLRRARAPFYSHTGRPSVDPELMIRMLLVGYCYSIRSERRLCQEVEPNLAELYRRKVENLREALATPETRTEAIEILRGLIEAIRLHPIEGGFEIELIGDIANMLQLPEKGSSSLDAHRCSVKLVAGACNQLAEQP